MLPTCILLQGIVTAEIPTLPRLPPIIRFGLLGLFTTLLHAALYELLLWTLAWHPSWCSVLAWCVAVLVSFQGQRHLVFGDNSNRATFLRFITAAIAAVSAHAGIIALCYDGIGWGPHLSYIIASAIVAVASFLTNKYWVFTGQPAQTHVQGTAAKADSKVS